MGGGGGGRREGDEAEAVRRPSHSRASNCAVSKPF